MLFGRMGENLNKKKAARQSKYPGPTGGRPDPGVDPGSNQAAVVRAVPGDMRYVAGGVDER